MREPKLSPEPDAWSLLNQQAILICNANDARGGHD
jgi:hypothetical protein